MTDFHISSFAELHDVLSRYRHDNRWIFRGHSHLNWRLVPKAGRPPFAGNDDRRAFEAWKRRAIEYITTYPNDDWGWLAIAQHHGLATRLLDWTYNPLAAAFFAVSEYQDSDAVIFVHKPALMVVPEKIHPMDCPEVALYKPMGIVPRITRQGGLFTVHGKPDIPMEDAVSNPNELERIIIDKVYRTELIFELSHYGVNRASLFPDLDGLSAYMNWVAASRDYWRNPIDAKDAI